MQRRQSPYLKQKLQTRGGRHSVFISWRFFLENYVSISWLWRKLTATCATLTTCAERVASLPFWNRDRLDNLHSSDLYATIIRWVTLSAPWFLSVSHKIVCEQLVLRRAIRSRLAADFRSIIATTVHTTRNRWIQTRTRARARAVDFDRPDDRRPFVSTLCSLPLHFIMQKKNASLLTCLTNELRTYLVNVRLWRLECSTRSRFFSPERDPTESITGFSIRRHGVSRSFAFVHGEHTRESRRERW